LLAELQSPASIPTTNRKQASNSAESGAKFKFRLLSLKMKINVTAYRKTLKPDGRGLVSIGATHLLAQSQPATLNTKRTILQCNPLASNLNPPEPVSRHSPSAGLQKRCVSFLPRTCNKTASVSQAACLPAYLSHWSWLTN